MGNVQIKLRQALFGRFPSLVVDLYNIPLDAIRLMVLTRQSELYYT